MRFFLSAHDPNVSAVLDSAVEAPSFERFYRAQLGKRRLTRLGYIRRLFTDARLIVPVPSPSPMSLQPVP